MGRKIAAVVTPTRGEGGKDMEQLDKELEEEQAKRQRGEKVGQRASKRCVNLTEKRRQRQETAQKIATKRREEHLAAKRAGTESEQGDQGKN